MKKGTCKCTKGGRKLCRRKNGEVRFVGKCSTRKRKRKVIRRRRRR